MQRHEPQPQRCGHCGTMYDDESTCFCGRGGDMSPREPVRESGGHWYRIEAISREFMYATYGVHPNDVFPPIPRGEMAAEQVMQGLEDLAREDPFGAMMGKYDDPRYLDIEEEP